MHADGWWRMLMLASGPGPWWNDERGDEGACTEGDGAKDGCILRAGQGALRV